MAEIVAAMGVPHTPMFPALVARLGPECEVARLYAEVARQLAAVQPDVLVIFDSDHLNTFFLNNLPVFSVGVGARISGPNDETPMPHYEVPVHDRLAAHLRHGGVEAGFDLAMAQDFTVDHSIMVPLHFLTPQMQTPIVPMFINGLVPPLPEEPILEPLIAPLADEKSLQIINFQVHFVAECGFWETASPIESSIVRADMGSLGAVTLRLRRFWGPTEADKTPESWE